MELDLHAIWRDLKDRALHARSAVFEHPTTATVPGCLHGLRPIATTEHTFIDAAACLGGGMIAWTGRDVFDESPRERRRRSGLRHPSHEIPWRRRRAVRSGLGTRAG